MEASGSIEIVADGEQAQERQHRLEIRIDGRYHHMPATSLDTEYAGNCLTKAGGPSVNFRIIRPVRHSHYF